MYNLFFSLAVFLNFMFIFVYMLVFYMYVGRLYFKLVTFANSTDLQEVVKITYEFWETSLITFYILFSFYT